MDLNIQATDTASRKRNYDAFSIEGLKTDADADTKASATGATPPSGDCFPPLISDNCIRSSSHGSQASSEALSSTREPRPSSPQTPTKGVPPENSTADMQPSSQDASTRQASPAAKPVAKRKRLTPKEKEARDKEAADRKRDKDEQAALKTAEKAKQEEEKAARAKMREQQAAIKAAEKARLEEEKTARVREREEKRKKKEEEQKRLQEEKEKKAKSQKKLNDFFTLSSTPKKTSAGTLSESGSPNKSDTAGTTSKLALSAYDQLFKPFFVRQDTRWTSSTVQMDEATRETKSRNLDELISGQQEPESPPKPFDAAKLLCLPCKPPKRGLLHHPVRHVMETIYKEAEKSEGTGGGAARNARDQAREKLAKVPMKVIAFSQDVRPPYYGTVTFRPFALGRGNMYRLARKTTDRRLPLDYDYDSEAEWQDEEGEDVDIDDDEEDQDDEDDMEGFLDDSEDAGLSRRVFANAMEPESSGICFENQHGVGPYRTAYEHRMEFMQEGLECGWGIDPWSVRYWELEHKSKTTKSAHPAEDGTKMAPPPAPASAYEAMGRNAAETAKPTIVKLELLNDVKKAILDHKTLSKVGIIDYIFHEFRDSVSRAQVKSTLEMVAEKKGVGRIKMWNLKPGHEIEL